MNHTTAQACHDKVYPLPRLDTLYKAHSIYRLFTVDYMVEMDLLLLGIII